jgi:S-adenosylmethionine hydrolase
LTDLAHRPCVTLLTDFATSDGYVGAMKGVIASRCPSVPIHDITHGIAPGDVRAGAFALATAASYFPSGTVHVAVVDPGVGTARRGLLVEAAGAFFVGPDNGLLSLAAAGVRSIYELDRPAYQGDRISPTFHGRDVFAAVAGHLAAGTRAADAGTPVESMVELELPVPERCALTARGEVVHVDSFGNLITNLRIEDLPVPVATLVVEVGDRLVGTIVETYGDVAVAEPAALVGSAGYLEIAVRDGRAEAVIKAGLGSDVVVRARDPHT